MFWKVTTISGWLIIATHVGWTHFMLSRESQPYTLLVCQNKAVRQIGGDLEQESLDGCTDHPYAAANKKACQDAAEVTAWMLSIYPVTRLFKDGLEHHFIWQCVPSSTLASASVSAST